MQEHWKGTFQEGDPEYCRKCASGLPAPASQTRLHGGLTAAVQEGIQMGLFQPQHSHGGRDSGRASRLWRNLILLWERKASGMGFSGS